MKRRDLLAALATAPTAGWAQARPAKIGLLAAIAPPPGAVEAFRDGMRQRGYVEGRDVSIDVRSPQGSLLVDPGVVTDLIRSGVDVMRLEQKRERFRNRAVVLDDHHACHERAHPSTRRFAPAIDDRDG